MFKSVALLGISALAMGLAACGEPATEPAAEAPAPAAPAEPVVEKPSRTAQTPLPTADAIAQNLVEAIGDETKARYFAPKPEENFPGGVRMAPESQAVIFPPTNAVTLTISATLEPDAWIHQKEYNTDGIAIAVDAIGANGASLGKQELVVDPTVAKQADPPASISVAIPAEAAHLEISFKARGNGALDNTTVVLGYE